MDSADNPRPASAGDNDERDNSGTMDIVCLDGGSAEDAAKKSKYSCVKCPFSSFYPGNLRVHMRRHTGEKPFRCEFCSRPFSDKSNLNSHRRRKHTTSSVLQYSSQASSSQRKSQRGLSKNLSKNRYYHMYESRMHERIEYQSAQAMNFNEEGNYGDDSISDDKISGIPETSGVYLQHDYGGNDLPTMVPNAYATASKGINQEANSDFPKVFSVDSAKNDSEKRPTSPQQYEFNQDMSSAPIDYSQNDLFSLKQSFKNSNFYPMNSTTLEMEARESPGSPGEEEKEQTLEETCNNSDLLVQNIGCQTDLDKESKMHECKHCLVLFRDFVMYTIHMGCHGCDDPFRCNVCGLDCESRHQFACHFARGHTKTET